MQNMNNTQYFRVEKEPEIRVHDVLKIVYRHYPRKGTIRSIRLLDILCLVIRLILPVTIMQEV